jgi:hypothetical protein
MKPYLKLSRAAFLALALGTVSVTAAFAQTPAPSGTTPATPPPADGGGFKHHFDAGLTDAEKTQLKNAHDAVIATNPDLKAEEASLKTQRESLGDNATPEQKQALFTQFHDFHTKMQAAMLKVDPSLAPVFAKLEAAHKGWKHSQAPAQT